MENIAFIEPAQNPDFDITILGVKNTLIDRGYEIREIKAGEISSPRPTDFYFGSIGIVKEAVSKMGLSVPDIGIVPTAEFNAYKRYIQVLPKKEVLTTVRENPDIFRNGIFFAKSFVSKRAAGSVININNLFGYQEIDWMADDELVILQEVVNFDEFPEWRFYIEDGRVAWMSMYRQGESRGFTPHFDAMYDLAKITIPYFKNRPVCFSMDFGFFRKDGQVHCGLIEVNDAYALGNYGMARLFYTRMVLRRWAELTQTDFSHFWE